MQQAPYHALSGSSEAGPANDSQDTQYILIMISLVLAFVYLLMLVFGISRAKMYD